jgi:DNA-directed RNA polymerase subunit RPC12/RpoP
MSSDKTQGLTCPTCTGVVPVPEGMRIVQCPYCGQRSLVQGERGVRRWQVLRNIERAQVEQAVKDFFSGIKKATGLKKEAKIQEIFLIYLPYWRVVAFVAGWMFGRVKSGKDSTRPVEVEVMEEMQWNDAAADVSEFGVHRVLVSKRDLEPYDAQGLHRDGMVFEPSESRTEAMAEAERHFTYRARSKKRLKRKFFEKFHFLRPQLSLVYYPLWITRYEYRKRNYQVVVDGVKGEVLYGKAPGNIFYRAAALVVGMALGNLILVNGTILALLLLSGSSDDEGALLLLLIPLAIGLALIVAGYRAFRYGEEVEEMQAEARKARLAGWRSKKSKGLLDSGLSFVEELSGSIE